MVWLLLTIFIDEQGSEYGAPRASNNEVFDTYEQCATAIIDMFNTDNDLLIRKDLAGNIYATWSGYDFIGYYVCAPSLKAS